MSDSIAASGSRRWFWRFIVLLILAAGVGGFVALQKFKPRPAVRPAVQQLPLVQAQTLKFQSEILPVVGHGLVRPRVEVVLSAEVSGRIIQVSPAMVTGGSFRAGELLVRLDPEPFRAALAQAQADHASAQAALKLAQQLVSRTEDLIAKGFLSRQTLDERLAARDQAQAALARSQALERQRTLDLQRTQLHAPFNGRVLTEKLDVGDTVQPGKELARIFPADSLEIAVSLTDRDVALVSDPWGGADAAVSRATVLGKSAQSNAAAKATVVVAHGGLYYAWDAQVDRIEAAVDAATRTFNLVVRVNHPQARGKLVESGVQRGGPHGPPLIVGMYARVEVAGRDHGRYAMIPRTALRDGSVIWLLDAQGRIALRKVRVLSEHDEQVAIAAQDLPEGGRLVTSDLAVVTEGLEVRVIEAR